MKIQIRPGLEIGDDCPTFIIAEVGSNWRNLDDCLMSIEKAKECGADAVKFQLFNYECMYGLDKVEIDDDYMGIKKHLDNGFIDSFNAKALPLDWLPKLKEKADHHGVEFMCSAFSPELIDAVDPYVSIHKLASAEMCHVRMLEKLREIGKPVFMSTGGHTVDEIGQAIDCLYGRDTQTPDKDLVPLILMYCVAAYPAREVYLEHIPFLRQRFNSLVGYSDHSLDVAVLPKQACEVGACVIEKHFTAIDADTPDRDHSLNPSQFGNMVRFIRGTFLYPLGPTPDELPMVQRHNRRLIATKDIQIGSTLIEEGRGWDGANFGIYRALKDDPHALSPYRINEVNGKVTLRAIKCGDGICVGDFE